MKERLQKSTCTKRSRRTNHCAAALSADGVTSFAQGSAGTARTLPADPPAGASRSLPAVSVASRKRLRLAAFTMQSQSSLVMSPCTISSWFLICSERMVFPPQSVVASKYTRKLVSCEYNTSSSAQGQAEHFQRCIIPLAARKKQAPASV